MLITEHLKQMVLEGASDLFLTVGCSPLMKIGREYRALSREALTPDQTRQWVLDLMDEAQQAEFLAKKELNFAVSASGIGRFRASAFFQRNVCGAVLRHIKSDVPSMDQLGLPQILRDLALAQRGLVLLVGATGAGKSTSLAAMIDHRNQQTSGHILMVEDPIEYLHQHQGCIVTQREVGIDTESVEIALKNGLRQAPDVIMIGEINSREAMEQALIFAETGALCMATLHANNTYQALERITHFFPIEQHAQILMDLSLNLQGIIAQRLISQEGSKHALAVHEIMLNTPVIADVIRKGETQKARSLMSRQQDEGMQTFDQALFAFYQQERISYEQALACADSANDLRLMIKLDSNDVAKSDGDGKERSGLKLQD